MEKVIGGSVGQIERGVIGQQAADLVHQTQTIPSMYPYYPALWPSILDDIHQAGKPAAWKASIYAAYYLPFTSHCVICTAMLSQANSQIMRLLLCQIHLRWLGHIHRMNDGRITKDFIILRAGSGTLSGRWSCTMFQRRLQARTETHKEQPR